SYHLLVLYSYRYHLHLHSFPTRRSSDLGTVVGEAGSGLLITTLDFALRNFLDVTSIITGWGQSGEAGGKAHFAGVGFGGENALRSEEHTSELQSRENLVCRLLLEKKKHG